MRVGPGFFQTLGAQVIAGRDFDERDLRPPGDQPRAYRTVIVSESFMRRYFQDQNPIGARIGLGNRPDTQTTIEIVGVVKDFSRRSLRDEQVETIFLQYFRQPVGRWHVLRPDPRQRRDRRRVRSDRPSRTSIRNCR